jgi:hypothetical protein
MDKNSLEIKITEAVNNMITGRRSREIEGKAEEGRVLLNIGQKLLVSTLNDVIASGDVALMLDAMMFFTVQELAQNDAGEPVARKSAETAMEKFQDALLALEAVKSDSYWVADKVISHQKKFRRSGMPKDAFHYACDSDRMRILKGLAEFGHSSAMIELSELRRKLVDTAQSEYCLLQQKALLEDKKCTDSPSR